MQNINKNPVVKKGLEGAALLVALVGAFYLGQTVTQVEFVDLSTTLEAYQTASIINAIDSDPFSKYEYVLIDNSKGIRDIKAR